MESVMKAWKIVLTILLTAAICSVVGYGYGRRGSRVSTSVADTICFRDTVRDSIPMPVYETLVLEVPELFPVYITLDGDTIHDSIYIPVPITSKEYQTENYRAWVSGYKPSLDSVWVYPEKIIIREKSARWGIGVIAGYGIGRNGLSPYVGIGGYWRVW